MDAKVASFIDCADGKGDTCIGRQTMRQQLKLAKVVATKCCVCGY